MYVQGFVLGVKTDGQEEYLKVARAMGEMFIEFGALEATENWEADVPDGEVTDFRKAVAAEPGEKIVFSWIVWPDKETCDVGTAKMMEDERMTSMEFPEVMDGRRMILGSFDQIYRITKEGRGSG
ncbi:MAG: DUF1428 domain-containing protein [Pseudomonadota bacterium]